MNKNGTQVTLNLLSNIVADDDTDFPYKLLSANTKFSKTQLPKLNWEFLVTYYTPYRQYSFQQEQKH